MSFFESRLLLEVERKFLRFERIILGALLVILSILFCYFATLPKYEDFWGLILLSEGFAAGHYDIYKYMMEIAGPASINGIQPPGYMILEGIWIKMGALMFHWDFGVNWATAKININNPEGFPLWGMIPYLFALFSMVILTLKTVKDKWLALIWFGPLAFVSMMIVGNSDIFVASLIFISLIFALKSFKEENFLKFQFISIIFLGLSLWFKTFGGLLFPIYFLCFTTILSKKYSIFSFKFVKNVILYPIIFVLISLVIWIPYYQYYLTINMSRASVLWGSTISLFSENNISIWLIGFLVILYSLFKILTYNENVVQKINNIFILYIFISFSWMFMTVYSHTQWWLILIPCIILILDNNNDILNYTFYFSLAIVYLLHPLKWATVIVPALNFYYPVQLIIKFAPTNFLIIVDTLIFSLLLIWNVDLLKNNFFKDSKRIVISSKFSKIFIILPIFALFILLIICRLPEFLS